MKLSLKIDKRLASDVIIWRYLDLGKLVAMLDKKALWLARADSVRDRHEGRFPTDMRRMIEQAYDGLIDKDENSPVKNADDFQDFLLKNTFISCWHKNLDENMIMWEIYGREKNTVAVQTTVGHLANSLNTSNLVGHSLNLKEVIYEDADKINGAIPYEECFFRKRPHFVFEREVRISLDTYSRSHPSKDTPPGYSLPICINSFVISIVVHPDAPDWFYEVVVAIAKKFNVHTRVETGECGNG